jgi:hypothetical protein
LALKEDGMTVIVGGGGLQLHGILTEFTGPANVNVALAGQGVSGTTMFICDCWPGVNVPFAGKKAIPFMPLLDAVQFRLPWAFGALLSVSTHTQP